MDKQLSARLSANGERIIMSGDIGSPEAQEFFHSLPSCRHRPTAGTQSCLATPITAWRIFGNVLFEDRCSADVEEIGENIRQAIATPDADPESRFDQPLLQGTYQSKRHQCEAFWFANRVVTPMLAMEMGTMKSKVAVDIAVNGDCKSVLIICPKSVLGVWRREFRLHAGLPFSVHVCEKGTVAKKAEAAKKHMATNGRSAVVINYESACHGPMDKYHNFSGPFARFALSRKWDCVIMDEAHRIGSHASKQSKFAAKLRPLAGRRICLTGTPMDSPMNLFGQFRFLDPGVFGTSFVAFRSRYAKMDNPYAEMAITGYQNQGEMAKKMAWLSYRVGDEVLDLPPEQHHVREFKMCPKAMRHYKELENEMITEVAGGVCTVANCLVKSIRLRQATSGFIVEDDTKQIHHIDDGRQKLLEELIEDMGAGEPVVVFANFVEDLSRIREVAEKLGRRYGEISGRQKDLTPDATMPDYIDMMGVQIQAGGVGIDLTRARYAIYYSQTYSLLNYLQSLKRIHRPGQTHPVSYYHLVAENTVDVAVRDALSRKQKVVDVVLEIFKKGK